jgi:serine/threonine protein phosphatase PrpC
VSTFDLALRSHTGTRRLDNQDACGRWDEGLDRTLFIVADGVGGYEGGQEASRLAVEVTLEAFRTSPLTWGPEKRLARAVQQANIAIHDRSLIVTELRHMRTTITAVVVDGRELYAAHVGDCRLYLVRDGGVVQLTKDHTVAAERTRLGMVLSDATAERAAHSTLTRCLGSDLIVALDRISRTLQSSDVLITCSDGVHNVLVEGELNTLTETGSAEEACGAILDAANAKGTPDNVTVAVLRMAHDLAPVERPSLRDRLARMIGR